MSVTGTRICLSSLTWVSEGAGPQTIEGTLPGNRLHSSRDPAYRWTYRQIQHKSLHLLRTTTLTLSTLTKTAATHQEGGGRGQSSGEAGMRRTRSV